MMHEKMRRGDRGVVLIVIVGVLAVLSLLAVTFGMMARVELAVSRNQTEYEMAREAAGAGVEALLNGLQSSLNGSSMTSGALPTFLPNSADTDGVLQYKRDGVKVYFAASDTVPTGSVTPDWLQGLGLQDAGMFNINAIGFANDLGSNCNPDIRYTSFDCSLVRLLTSRFATIATAPINSTDWANLLAYDANFGAKDLVTGIYTEQQRVAIELSRAIINWRNGPPPSGYNVALPGNPGTEERRLGHLPRWNSKLGWAASAGDVGVGYPPGATGKYDWGYQDGLPSLFINMLMGPLALSQQCSYFEPCVWSSFLGYPGYGATPVLQLAPWPPAPPNNPITIPTFPWGNDTGLPFPGLFWGKVLNYSTATLTADNSQPGWRDWPPSLWNGYYIYFATGPDKWCCAKITGSTATQLTLSTFWPFPQSIPATPLCPPAGTPAPSFPIPPKPGDAFCIFMPPPQSFPTSFTPGGYVGVLSKRWSSTDINSEGDLVPNAMLWPNGALATEGNVIDLMVDNNLQNSSGLSLNAGPYPQHPVANMGTFTQAVSNTDPSVYDTSKNWTPGFFASSATPPVYPYVVHIYAGTGRGQVRTIINNTATQLNLASCWTTGNTPDATSPSQYRIEWLDNNLPSKFQPNNLQGNNRLYLSLGGLRDSVVVPALVNDSLLGNPPPLSTAGAQAMADILIPYFLPYLTVSTQAIQASQSLCSINDWATDGVDNNGNGVVDEPLEAQDELSSPQGNAGRAALALSLYNGLGLHTWAHANSNPAMEATRIQQAAQLVANIIDFRDPTDVPTELTVGALDPAVPAADSDAIVYGAKGLHVTQVMPSPDAIYSATEPSTPAVPTPQLGWEMTWDGQTPAVLNPTELNDKKDWDFDSTNPTGNCWQVLTPDPTTLSNPVATFTFPNMVPGYYAMRLIGYPQNTIFNVIYSPPWLGGTSQTYYAAMTAPDPDTTYYAGTPPAQTPYWYTGFVRNGLPNIPPATDGSGALACFEVVPYPSGTLGSLTFHLQLSPRLEVNRQQFRGFALCAQYIQLTNIATHDINLAGWTVATDQTLPLKPPAPSTQTLPPAITIPLTYTRAADSKIIHTDRIHGAVVGAPGTPSYATFPINYGTYVICMCEEAYERQWTARSGDPDYIQQPTTVNGVTYPSPNGDGLWGDAVNEVCTLFPYGDCPLDPSTGVPAVGALRQNQLTMALLLGVRTGPTTGYQPAVMVNDPAPAADFIAGNVISAGQVLGGVDSLIPQLYNATNNTDPGSSPPTRLYCYSSIEKNVLLQPTWDTSTPPASWAPWLNKSAPPPYWPPWQINSTLPLYWAPCWNGNSASPNYDGAQLPTQLVAYQNVLTTVPNDPLRNPVPPTYIRTYLNRNYNNYNSSTPTVMIWNPQPPIPPPPTQAPFTWPSNGNPTLSTPSQLVALNGVPQNRVFPFILNRPYPTTGWLGLVPTSNTDSINLSIPLSSLPQPVPTGYIIPTGSWRTIDPNPYNSTGSGSALQLYQPCFPEQLLGTLMSNATVGGVYARFNINTAPEAALNSVFPSTFLTSGGGTPGVSATNSPPTPPLTGQATLTDTSQNWPTTPPATGGYTNMVVFIDAGTGQGQVRLITSNNATTLGLNRPWDTVPNTTSMYRIMNSQAGLIICAREQRVAGNQPYAGLGTFPAALANKSWATWDEFLNDLIFQNSPNAAAPGVLGTLGASGIGFYDSPETSTISNADAGAGTYADGFPDSSNEKKEWFMRFSNLFCLQSTSYQFTVAGLVFVDRPWDPVTMQNNEPVAMVRIEADVDLSTGVPSVVHMRYLTQQ